MLSRRGGGGPAIKIPDRRGGTGPALKTGDRRAGTGPAFKIGERVLCYEPDPRRTKMLYDAKVLDIRKASRDEKGGRVFEYFVHFQGWSSTWDRFVSADILRADNEDARAEQTRLFELTEEFRLQKMERKRKRKSSDKIRSSLDSNCSPVPSDSSDLKFTGKLARDERFSLLEDDDEIQFRFPLDHDHEKPANDSESETEPANSPRPVGEEGILDFKPETEEEEDICTEPINLVLPQQLKAGLEVDCRHVTGGKLVRLPAQPNIVFLLEGYVRNFAISKLAAVEKQNAKNYNQSRQSDKHDTDLFDGVINSINIAKEVAEGIRIIIDFHLGNILLYAKEGNQFIKSRGIRPHMENIERLVAGASPLPHETTPRSKPAGKKEEDSSRKRGTRSTAAGKKDTADPEVSGSAGSASSGTETPTLNPAGGLASTAVGQYPQTKQSLQIMRELQAWKLVPESMYFEEPVPTSLVYGGVHLARLLVKLPDLFVKMKFPNKKLKYMMKYLEFLAEYLNSAHEDIFNADVYLN